MRFTFKGRAGAAAVVTLVAMAVPASASAFDFSAPLSFDAGSTAASPVDLVAGDFDGDSDPDLAVVGSGGSSVSVLLGSAGPTFSDPFSLGSLGGNTPRFGILAGDFNEDLDLDLMTEDTDVLLGDPLAGSATFTHIGNFGPDNVGSGAVGDFNADGDPDVAIAAETGQDQVDIELGSTGGTFDDGQDIDDDDSDDVALGNFNAEQDSFQDVAYTAHDNPSVAVALGDGDGTFDPPAGLAPASPQAEQIAVGLLNDDADPDLVVTRRADNAVLVFLGQAGGTFSAGQPYGVGASPRGVAVADLDGDGEDDVATANFDADTVSVLAGDGSGSLAAAEDYPVGDAPRQVIVGEFGGDELPDLAFANGDDQVTILLGAAPELPQAEGPVFQKSVTAEPVSGSVTYSCPDGGGGELAGNVLLEIACQIDATGGRVKLTSADPTGQLQDMEFYGGAFTIGQVIERQANGAGAAAAAKKKGNKKGKKKPKGAPVAITVVKLTGPPLECGAGKSSAVAQTARKRGLWGSGNGRFRSRGRRSSATVRGTVWFTQDSCAGTLTKVVEGVVAVRDFGRNKTIVLKPGDSYLARAKGKRKKKK